jgi:hypothetical protein
MLRGINRTNSNLREILGARPRNGQGTRICAAPMLSSTHVSDLNPMPSRTSPLPWLQDGEKEESHMQTDPLSETQSHGRIHGKYVANLDKIWVECSLELGYRSPIGTVVMAR